MSRSVLSVRLGVFVLALAAAACAKTDAKSATSTPAASGGDVAPKASPMGVGGLTDSTSARADRGRIRGNEAAQVWLVEISDFQCPYCKQWHDQSFATLDKEYVQTGKVRLAYLNHPIPSLHPNARAASEVAMCASTQGKFWELHSALFTTQDMWAKLPEPGPFFDTLAVKSGVEAAAWRSCMKSHATLPLIDADNDRTSSSGVRSTPTFFVGSRKIEGAYPVDSFRVILNEAIAKAGGPK
ncbi:MAG: thioredoxin domain-containing protein [Gemmatimonadaceae bacterium]